MNESSTVEWLSNAIKQATRSAKFCVAGSFPGLEAGLDVEGVGPIKLPLLPKTVKKLVAACRVAPYGKGTETLVDTKVRKTFELDPIKFRLSDEWNSAMASLMPAVAERLGLPADQLEGKLYKLLVYETGGFFLTHRDSEKQAGMVASMIVVLPNLFSGGTLVVRHGGEEQRLHLMEAATGKAPCYAAFYADCEHEIEHVMNGVRVCLAYNLVLKPSRKSPANEPLESPQDDLVDSIITWVEKQPKRPLVFALEHHYTSAGLSLELLKGADRQLAELVCSAAEATNCLSHFSQVERHRLQFADDGNYSKYNRKPGRKIKVGETYEDNLSGTEWTNIDGKKQPFGKIAFDMAAIVSSIPVEDWKPTTEDFEGFTGNEGNTLERWYHRSAIVLWHRDQHFDVVASSGASESIPFFQAMLNKLAKTPKKRIEEARTDCLRFARAIVEMWPQQGYGYRTEQVKTALNNFPELLLKLHDRDLIAKFLAKVAEHDPDLSIDTLVVAACSEFGWKALEAELKQLFSLPVNAPAQRRPELAIRDVDWLSAYCCDKTVDHDKAELAKTLCSLAVERFCKPGPPRPSYYSPTDRSEATIAEDSLPLLLKAIAAGGRSEDLSRVIDFAKKFPSEFSLDFCQVPTLKALIPWSKKTLKNVPQPLAKWLTEVREHLESITAEPPSPPADMTRPANFDCQCRFCGQLKAFLSDPVNPMGKISAAESSRRHLLDEIHRNKLDVTHTLERRGSPLSLIFTKTTGSYERSVKRFEADQKLLATLLKVAEK